MQIVKYKNMSCNMLSKISITYFANMLFVISGSAGGISLIKKNCVMTKHIKYIPATGANLYFLCDPVDP